eukprot:7580379-Karenia_brevis.AAC.1
MKTAAQSDLHQWANQPGYLWLELFLLSVALCTSSDYALDLKAAASRKSIKRHVDTFRREAIQLVKFALALPQHHLFNGHYHGLSRSATFGMSNRLLHTAIVPYLSHDANASLNEAMLTIQGPLTRQQKSALNNGQLWIKVHTFGGN